MKNLRALTLSGLLGLTLVMSSTQVFAEQNDAQVMEELARFADESEKMRESFIQKSREEHLKFVNDLYDLKLAHIKEINQLWKQFKPHDKEGNAAIRDKMDDQRKKFKKDEKKFRDEFHDSVLKKKKKEFMEIMKKRDKELKEKYKD